MSNWTSNLHFDESLLTNLIYFVTLLENWACCQLKCFVNSRMISSNNFKYMRRRALLLPWKITCMYYCCLMLGIWILRCINYKVCSGTHLSLLSHCCLFAWLPINIVPCCKLLQCFFYNLIPWCNCSCFLLYQLNGRYVQSYPSCCWGGFKGDAFGWA